jgi:hypothetical protein
MYGKIYTFPFRSGSLSLFSADIRITGKLLLTFVPAANGDTKNKANSKKLIMNERLLIVEDHDVRAWRRLKGISKVDNYQA